MHENRKQLEEKTSVQIISNCWAIHYAARRLELSRELNEVWRDEIHKTHNEDVATQRMWHGMAEGEKCCRPCSWFLALIKLQMSHINAKQFAQKTIKSRIRLVRTAVEMNMLHTHTHKDMSVDTMIRANVIDKDII